MAERYACGFHTLSCSKPSAASNPVLMLHCSAVLAYVRYWPLLLSFPGMVIPTGPYSPHWLSLLVPTPLIGYPYWSLLPSLVIPTGPYSHHWLSQLVPTPLIGYPSWSLLPSLVILLVPTPLIGYPYWSLLPSFPGLAIPILTHFSEIKMVCKGVPTFHTFQTKQRL